MSRSLRVFVSSTMRDLANERDAVCSKLRRFNFEPVNAEGWYPSGARTWETIVDEIESSDVFVLILGERYGWIPDSGPMSNEDRSVTHLEFLAAKDRNVPILPFLKNLSYDSDRESDDAKRRDKFRGEVSEWANGTIVGSFELARDLSNSAANAVVGLLTSDFLKHRLKQRAPLVERAATRLLTRDQSKIERTSLALPANLESSVLRGECVLFAGAGLSLSAGMPSAVAAWDCPSNCVNAL